MATPTISPSTIVISPGGQATATVSWTLDGGFPTVIGTLTLSVDGHEFTVPVEHQGQSPERRPRLVTSDPAPGDVLVTCDVASIVLLSEDLDTQSIVLR